ncbi:MAG TPA: hypothetical protein VJ869_03285 [Sphaerochaeta sp.]|jgi:hypothetical protein|nr:hypothetical protein [Spirochaetales bacterium]HKM05991.1 hypothetical protein [Sphaerochaeta sp.]
MATFKDNLLVNRIIALLIGGLLVFAIMSLTVVKTGNKENAQLSVALDEERYEAGRLLADAKIQFENKNYSASKATLEKLFIYQPGSSEAAEGKTLLAGINKASEAASARWEAALPQVKDDWSQAMATKLRAQSEKERADMETNLEKTIDQAWNKAKDGVRKDWENQDNEPPTIS